MPRIFRAVRRVNRNARFYPLSGAISIRRNQETAGKGTILVVAAGTSDIPVAEEAAVTAEIMGNKVESFYDVGVAGLHRCWTTAKRSPRRVSLFALQEWKERLPSVVAGLVAAR